MNACQVCQQELAPGAVERGEAVLAKGQPVCRACADRLGIQADAASFPRPRSATETVALPAAPAARSSLPAVLTVLLAAAAGVGAWGYFHLRAEMEGLRSRPAPPAPAPGVERQVQALQAQLAEAESRVAALQALLEGESRRREELLAGLRDEARQARQDAASAREASERAARALGQEVADAVSRALSDRPSPPPVAPPVSPEPAGPVDPEMADQFWAACVERAQGLARQGRYFPAWREYERIPKRHRRADYGALTAKVREGLELKARESVDLALKSLDRRIKDGDDAGVEQLLLQLIDGCGFPAQLDRLQPLLDDVRRRVAERTDRDARLKAIEQARVMERALRDLGGRDVEARQRAVESLKTLGEAAVPDLLQALAGGGPDVRLGVLMALSGIRSPAGVPGAVACLADADRRVRAMAVDVLGELGDPRAVSKLIDVLGDADEALARQAELSLERITRHVPEAPASGKPADYIPAWKAWQEKGVREIGSP